MEHKIKGMTILMTYSVYSIRISSDMPVESEYLPLVTLYFMLCIMNTFLAFNWFLIANKFLAKSKTPKLLTCLALRIRSVFILNFIKRKTNENSSTVSPNKDELETQANENNTSKTRCNKCDLCEKCEQKSLNDEEKKVKKDLNESNVSLLNYFFWFVLLTFMVASDLIIWLLISN